MVGSQETAYREKMNAGAAAAVAKADLIKWWDALDAMLVQDPDAQRAQQLFLAALRLARESQHPDARWLVSLLPAGEDVTPASLREVMQKQGNDARGMHIAWLMGDRRQNDLLARAAEKGYAPAQALLSAVCEDGDTSFALAQRAADQGDRSGFGRLGYCLIAGTGCISDSVRAVGLLKEAAELGSSWSQWMYGQLAFSAAEWEHYHWMALAAAKGYNVVEFCESVLALLPRFKKGDSDSGRILLFAAPVVRANVDGAKKELCGRPVPQRSWENVQRLLRLHEAMINRARRAIDCWSMAGRRLGLAKDMRVTIAKMAWAEAWVWGEMDKSQSAQKPKHS
jgi:hypothetical protein